MTEFTDIEAAWREWAIREDGAYARDNGKHASFVAGYEAGRTDERLKAHDESALRAALQSFVDFAPRIRALESEADSLEAGRPFLLPSQSEWFSRMLADAKAALDDAPYEPSEEEVERLGERLAAADDKLISWQMGKRGEPDGGVLEKYTTKARAALKNTPQA